MLDKKSCKEMYREFIVSKWSRLAGTKMMLGREDIYDLFLLGL